LHCLEAWIYDCIAWKHGFMIVLPSPTLFPKSDKAY